MTSSVLVVAYERLIDHSLEQRYSHYLTDSQGVYQICGLNPAIMPVKFQQFPSATTWYNGNNLPQPPPLRSVSPAGATYAKLNRGLNDLGACISGKILDINGQEIRSNFMVYDLAGNCFIPGRWVGLTYGYRRARCHYVTCGLAAGTYIVKAIGYMSGESEPVTVGTGEVKTGVNVIVGLRIYLPSLSNKAALL